MVTSEKSNRCGLKNMTNVQISFYICSYHEFTCKNVAINWCTEAKVHTCVDRELLQNCTFPNLQAKHTHCSLADVQGCHQFLMGLPLMGLPSILNGTHMHWKMQNCATWCGVILKSEAGTFFIAFLMGIAAHSNEWAAAPTKCARIVQM